MTIHTAATGEVLEYNLDMRIKHFLGDKFIFDMFTWNDKTRYNNFLYLYMLKLVVKHIQFLDEYACNLYLRLSM